LTNIETLVIFYMKRNIILAGILFFFLTDKSVAQAQKSLQIEINQQVWKPFINGFSNNNKEVFRAVHSRDVIRVIQDDNTIWNYDQYFPDQYTGPTDTSARYKKSIELRFIQRIASVDKAFEAGYYKSTSISPDGTTRTSYGKFNVVLRKENGVWKILVDADTSKGVAADDFNKAEALE
jgi:hypothetical protein